MVGLRVSGTAEVCIQPGSKIRNPASFAVQRERSENWNKNY
jgi:hypothetical protein